MRDETRSSEIKRSRGEEKEEGVGLKLGNGRRKKGRERKKMKNMLILKQRS